jgi:hypothetical protein
LIEAKAHHGELLKEEAGKALASPVSANSMCNHVRIGACLHEASIALASESRCCGLRSRFGNDLCVWEAAPEIPQFAKGERYLAAAQRLVDPRARQGTGLGGIDAVAFTPVQCTGTVSQAPGIIRDLGVGQPPR